jgi:predicted RNase H-like HicB family nuclease
MDRKGRATHTFTGVFIERDEWYIGYAEELPGANTQGKTLEEAEENLREAIELILVANRELTERELAEKEHRGEISSSKVTRKPITVSAV